MSTKIHPKKKEFSWTFLSMRIHPLKVSTRIRPIWKKVSTRIHCPSHFFNNSAHIFSISRNNKYCKTGLISSELFPNEYLLISSLCACHNSYNSTASILQVDVFYYVLLLLLQSFSAASFFLLGTWVQRPKFVVKKLNIALLGKACNTSVHCTGVIKALNIWSNVPPS